MLFEATKVTEDIHTRWLNSVVWSWLLALVSPKAMIYLGVRMATLQQCQFLDLSGHAAVQRTSPEIFRGLAPGAETIERMIKEY